MPTKRKQKRVIKKLKRLDPGSVIRESEMARAGKKKVAKKIKRTSDKIVKKTIRKVDRIIRKGKRKVKRSA